MIATPQLGLDFDGPTYVRELDEARLGAQLLRVRDCMRDGKWRTLGEIADLTGDPVQSISARLRDLRKERFGGHVVIHRRRGEAKRGIWEYRIA